MLMEHLIHIQYVLFFKMTSWKRLKSRWRRKWLPEKCIFASKSWMFQIVYLKQYRETITNKGFYIHVPKCLSKSTDYESNCCSKQLRETTSLFKIASKMATKTIKITFDQIFKPIDINNTKHSAVLFKHYLCAYT